MSYIFFHPSLSSASLQSNTISISMHAIVRFPIRIFHFDTWTFSICMKWLEMISFAKYRILLFHAIIIRILFFLYMLLQQKKNVHQTHNDEKTNCWLHEQKRAVVRDEQDSLKWITFFSSRYILQTSFAEIWNVSAVQITNVRIRNVWKWKYVSMNSAEINILMYSVQRSLICDVGETKSENNLITLTVNYANVRIYLSMQLFSIWIEQFKERISHNMNIQ